MDARVLIACLAAVSLDSVAGGIYKCVDGGATTYQSAPCARGQAETTVSVAAVSTNVAADRTSAVPAAAVPEPRKRGPWSHATIEVGVTDDEVLNMPGWGRPAQISRSRVARGWEEVWRYGNGYNGGRELRFVNARLADIVETPYSIASAR